MVNAQNWLNGNYPLTGRVGITKLKIRSKGLGGELDLRDFVNLKELDIWGNKITGIDISNCPHLKILECAWNEITSLDLSNCCQLTTLDVHHNCLTNLDVSNNRNLQVVNVERNQIVADLNIFSHLVNLKKLEIEDWNFSYSRSEPKNSFSGSLTALRDCQNLESLNIKNQTQLVGGLEDLPLDRLQEFSYDGTTYEGELSPLDNTRFCQIKLYQATKRIEKIIAFYEEQLTTEREVHKESLLGTDRWYRNMIISLERENKEVTANLKEGKAKAEKELASLKEVIAQGKNEEIEPILESINHIIVNWGIFFERKHDQEIEEEKRKTQVITGQLEAEKRVVKRVQKQRDDLIAQVEQEHGKWLMVGIGISGGIFLIYCLCRSFKFLFSPEENFLEPKWTAKMKKQQRERERERKRKIIFL